MKELDDKFIEKLGTIGVDAESINTANQEIADGIINFVSNAMDCVKSLYTDYDLNVPSELIGPFLKSKDYYQHSTVRMGNFSMTISLVFDTRCRGGASFRKKQYYNRIVLDKMLKKHNITIEFSINGQKPDFEYLTIVYTSKVKLDYKGIVIPKQEGKQIKKTIGAKKQKYYYNHRFAFSFFIEILT